MHESHRSPPILALTALVALGWAAPLPGAQNRPALDDRAEVGRVTPNQVLILSFRGLDRAPNALTNVFRLPDGGWGVASMVFDGVIQRFDAAGQPTGLFGGSGEGPGELGTGFVFGVSTDSQVWVVDPANARMTVFSRALRLLSDRLLPGRTFDAAPATDGRSILISGFLPGSRAIGRLSVNPGEDVFGGEILASPNARVQMQAVAETGRGEVWSISRMGGAVNVHRSADLSIIGRYRLPYADLTETQPVRPGSGEPRPPEVAGITAGDAGLLWVLIGVPDSDWTPDVDLADGSDRVFDTRILAIDTAARAVVGELRLDPLCMPITDGHISCVDELGEAVRIIELDWTPVREGS